MVFTQRMALPVVRHQYAPEKRMPFEPNPEHIPDFALVPVCRRPDIHYAFDRRVFSFKRDFEPDVFVPAEGHEMIDHREVVVWTNDLGITGADA